LIFANVAWKKKCVVSLKKVSDPLQCINFIPISEKDSSLRDTRERQTFIGFIGLILFFTMITERRFSSDVL
jgi:hypothetical protein